MFGLLEVGGLVHRAGGCRALLAALQGRRPPGANRMTGTELIDVALQAFVVGLIVGMVVGVIKNFLHNIVA